LFRTISPGSPRFQETEFTLLLAWALLFPAKIGYSYYLGFMFLLAFFTIAKASRVKNIAIDRFSLYLLLFNLLFIFSSFFSPHPYKSFLFCADVLMVSSWFMLFYLEEADMGRLLRLAAWVITVSSLIAVSEFAVQGGRGPVTVIFKNPILQGVASALAAMVFLHALLRKYRHAELALLALNCAAVIISASKAAALGLAVFAAAMILRGKRRWLLYLFSILLLLALFPNPLRRMVVHSIRDDPYVLNRLDIWSMSARMFRAHPRTGVGPDLFAEASPRFNFPQEKGPARFFKIPESSHSDYWKVIAETGIAGLILVVLFLFAAIRRLLRPSSLSEWLLAFLLAQMLLFNLVFQFFFLLMFLFLLRVFFAGGRHFVAARPEFRTLASGWVALVLLVFYLLPFLADRSLARAAREKDAVRRYDLLHAASLMSPLDERVPLAKAALLLSFARSRSGQDQKGFAAGSAWADALDQAIAAQKLNSNSVTALEFEAELFKSLESREMNYPALADEILDPLRRAAELAPFNPFLKLRQAEVLRRFGRLAEARILAGNALDLEPNFAAALVFIHELDGLPADDPGFCRRLAEIREKSRRLRARPDSYLFRLYEVPRPPM